LDGAGPESITTNPGYGFLVRGCAEFVVLRSPATAVHDPDYEEIGRFPTREKAEAFLASVEME
jgi:hypothetical protein